MMLPLAPRLAWRSLRRHRLRSVLVILLLGFVAGGSTYLFTRFESSVPTKEESTLLTIGSAHTVLQRKLSGQPGSDARPPLPPGVIARQMTKHFLDACEISTAPVVDDEFQTRGHLREGRYPTSVGEVALGLGLCSQIPLGAKISIEGAERRVVGRVTDLGRAGNGDFSMVLTDPDPLMAKARAGSDRWVLSGAMLSPDQAHSIDEQGWLVIPRDKATTYVSSMTAVEYDTSTRITIASVFGISLIFVMALTTALMSLGRAAQRREAALLHATGARPSMVAAVQRWSALWLALLGVIPGTALGLGLISSDVMAAMNPQNTAYFGLHIPGWYVVAFAVAIVGTAVISANLASRRVSTQDAWSGVRRVDAPHGRRRFPWIGVALVLLGLGAMAWRQFMASGRGSWERDETQSSVKVLTLLLVPILVGAWLSLGWLLQQVAKIAWPWTPMRLVARDSARQLSRSVPMVMAIALAWMLVVGVSTLLLGDQTNESISSTARGQLAWSRDTPADLDKALKDVKESLGREPVALARGSVADGVYPDVDLQKYCGRSSLCRRGGPNTMAAYGIVIGGPEFLPLMLGRAPTDVERADFAGGKALVWGDGVVRDGQVELWWGNYRVGLLAATKVTRTDEKLRGGVLVPTSQASALPRASFKEYALADFGTLTRADIEKTRVARPVMASQADTTGSTGGNSVNWLMVALALTLLISMLSWLASADSRRDDATLAEVGASPTLRRRLAFATSVYLTTVGFVVGGFLGWLCAAIVQQVSFGEVTMLWEPAVVWVVVTAVTAAIAWLVTPKRPYKRPNPSPLPHAPF